MKIKVFPCETSGLFGAEYALAITSSGYESRGRFLWTHLRLKADARIVFQFPTHRVLDYEKNRSLFLAEGFVASEPTQSAVNGAVRAAFSSQPICSKEGPVRVVVDISCMTRLLIAATCYELSQEARVTHRSLVVDFVYACAEFGEVPNVAGPITANGPAIPALAGWPRNPSAPLGVIIGIGYEEDLALGVIEELEAANVWAFRPKDHDPRYEEAIELKNKGLFDEIPPANMIRYSLFDAFSLFSSVEALIGLAKNDVRLVVVPLGPKIFALVSCLATLRHHPTVGLWRVSSGENLTPVERRASGKIVAITATFDP